MQLSCKTDSRSSFKENIAVLVDMLCVSVLRPENQIHTQLIESFSISEQNFALNNVLKELTCQQIDSRYVILLFFRMAEGRDVY